MGLIQSIPLILSTILLTPLTTRGYGRLIVLAPFDGYPNHDDDQRHALQASAETASAHRELGAMTTEYGWIRPVSSG